MITPATRRAMTMKIFKITAHAVSVGQPAAADRVACRRPGGIRIIPSAFGAAAGTSALSPLPVDFDVGWLRQRARWYANCATGRRPCFQVKSTYNAMPRNSFRAAVLCKSDSVRSYAPPYTVRAWAHRHAGDAVRVSACHGTTTCGTCRAQHGERPCCLRRYQCAGTPGQGDAE